MTEKLALYIHWPWCRVKCPYCDFNSHAVPDMAKLDNMGQRYVAALTAEMRHWQALGVTGEVASVFFGGGTPSLMQPAWVGEILQNVRQIWPFSADCEVTVECNPTSAGEDSGYLLFAGLKAAGVNRVSVGVQGLRPENLAFLGRQHDVGQAMATLEAALAEIGNVNADVIYGLPGQEVSGWCDELHQLAAMGLTHLSAYQLTVEMNTAFYGQVARGAWAPLEGDAQADFFDATRVVLEGAGYENYEISNFAKPGRACQHNVLVWRYQPYLGLGAGAHGRVHLDGDGWVATQNRKMPERYMADMEDGVFWEGQKTAILGADAVQEALMMGLRLREGIDMETLKKRFGAAAWDEALENQGFRQFIDNGLLATDEGRLYVTAAGWGRLDGILRRILKPL